jgi:primase-polymerase (primpol)-like protein
MTVYSTDKRILPVQLENMPDELKLRPQWVNWRLEKRGGNPTKVPYTPGTERKASSTDLMTWGAFEEAIEVLDHYDGVGFVFSSADPYTGIDLDDCVEQETEEIKPWALEIVDYFDSYTELSATASGLHIIVKGEMTNRRKGEIEVYSSKRFFTMTGHVLGAGGD